MPTKEDQIKIFKELLEIHLKYYNSYCDRHLELTLDEVVTHIKTQINP